MQVAQYTTRSTTHTSYTLHSTLHTVPHTHIHTHTSYTLHNSLHAVPHTHQLHTTNPPVFCSRSFVNFVSFSNRQRLFPLKNCKFFCLVPAVKKEMNTCRTFILISSFRSFRCLTGTHSSPVDLWQFGSSVADPLSFAFMTFLEIIFELFEVSHASQINIRRFCKHSSSSVSHSLNTHDVSGEIEVFFVPLEPHTHKIYKATNYMEVQSSFRSYNPLHFYVNSLFIYKVLSIYHFPQSTVHYTLFLNGRI